MALVIDKIVDLTAYPDNPAPKLVTNLSIIHEAQEGEIVQYYIDKEGLQGDKRSVAIGVFDKNTNSWSYVTYDTLVWEPPKWRITSKRIERLGLKAFPGIGACAYFKQMYSPKCSLLVPVNSRPATRPSPPGQQVEWVNDYTLHFTISNPPGIEYVCFRIVLRCDSYAEEYITYDKEIDVEIPKMNGTYVATTQGYFDEGQDAGEPSAEFTFTVTGQSEEPPASTEASDIYLRSTTINDDTGQIDFKLNSGNTMEVTIAPYVAAQLQEIRNILGSLQGSVDITSFKLDVSNVGAVWNPEQLEVSGSQWQLRTSWSIQQATSQPLDYGYMAVVVIDSNELDELTEVTVDD